MPLPCLWKIRIMTARADLLTLYAVTDNEAITPDAARALAHTHPGDRLASLLEVRLLARLRPRAEGDRPPGMTEYPRVSIQGARLYPGPGEDGELPVYPTGIYEMALDRLADVLGLAR